MRVSLRRGRRAAPGWLVAGVVVGLLGVVGIEAPATAAPSFHSLCPILGSDALIIGSDPLGIPATSATLSKPVGIAISPVDGTTYVTEHNFHENVYDQSGTGRGRILRINPGGTIDELVRGPAGARLGALAISNDGTTLYVATVEFSGQPHRVSSIDLTAPTPTLVPFAGGGVDPSDGIAPTAAALGPVNDLAVSPSGTVFIAHQSTQVDHDANPGTPPLPVPTAVREIRGGLIQSITGPGPNGSGATGVPADTTLQVGPISLHFRSPSGELLIGSFRQLRRIVPAATADPYGDGLIDNLTASGADPDGDGGLATAATLADISTVVTDGSDNIYVGGPRTHVIRRIDAGTGLISTAAGGPAAPPTSAGSAGFADGTGDLARFAEVTDSAYFAGGVYVVDATNNRIRRIDTATDAVTTVAGIGPSVIENTGVAFTSRVGLTRGVATGPDGSIYVGDDGGHRVWRRSPDGTLSVVAGDGRYRPLNLIEAPASATSARFSTIKDVAWDTLNNRLLVLERAMLFSVDVTGDTITRVAGSGAIGGSTNTGPATAESLDTGSSGDLATDAAGRAYVATRNPGAGVETTDVRTVDLVAGTVAQTHTGTLTVVGLAADATGNLFIGIADGDANDHRIVHRDTSGLERTLVGADPASARGEADGPATAAQLYSPNDIVYAPGSGPADLYFTQSSGRVRGLVPGMGGTTYDALRNGTVITVAGSVETEPFGPGDWGDAADLSSDPGAARIGSPTGLAATGGRLVVVDDAGSLEEPTNVNPQTVRVLTDAGCSDGSILGPATVGTATSTGVPLDSLPLAQLPFDAATIAATPLRAVPLRASSVADAPLRASPLRAVPLRAVPLRASGIAGAPLRASDLTLSSLVLEATTYPGGWAERLAGTPFEGRPLQTIRLDELLDDPATPADETSPALTADPEITLTSIDLSTSPLRAVSIASIALGATPLRAVPLRASLAPQAGASDADRFAAWCDLLSAADTDPETPEIPEITSLGYDCADLGPDAPLLALDIRSVPLRAVPLRAVPLRAVDLSASPLGAIPLRASGLEATPLRASPLRAVPLQAVVIDSTPLRAVPLRAVPLRASDVNASPLRAVPLASLANPSAVSSCLPPSCVTLGDAADASAILPTATFGDLIDGLDEPIGNPPAPPTLGDLRFNTEVFAGIDADLDGDIDKDDEVDLWDIVPWLPDTPFMSLADALVGLVPAPDLPWEDLDLDALGLADLAGFGGVAKLDLGFRVYPGAVDPLPVTVTLPPGWRYQGTMLGVDPDGATPPASETPPAPAITLDPLTDQQTLAYSLPAASLFTAGPPNAPRTVTIGVTTSPGNTLGTFQATGHVGPVVAGGATLEITSNPVSVVDDDEISGTGSTYDLAEVIAPDQLHLGHINTPGDVDYYRVSADNIGDITTIHLSNLAADADVVVYEESVSDFNFRADVARLRQQAKAVEMAEPQFGVIGEVLEPQELDDVPVLPGKKLASIAARRGTANERIELINDGDDDPTNTTTDGVDYVIAVTSYGGATSTEPYLLRVQQFSPPGAAPCQATDFPRFDPPSGFTPSIAASSIPAGTETLVLVNRERLAGTYGNSASPLYDPTFDMAAFDTALGDFAARPDVNGLVIPVDAASLTELQTAYDGWDANPCGLGRPNTVVREINDHVDTLLASASPATRAGLRHMVVIGGDDQIPMARLIDNTKLANEIEYSGELRRQTSPGTWVSTPQTVALAARSLMSDDPYASLRPALFGLDVIYPPDFAIGRLVESPAEITATLDAFAAADGRLEPTSALVTGYDFLSDGASQVAATLDEDLTVNATLNGEDATWTRDDLAPLLDDSADPDDIVSLNAHFDHHQLQPAAGEVDPNAPLYTAEDIANGPADFTGRLLFSMGCHSGASAPDAYVGPTADGALDWAQVFAREKAVWVANSGYGYGDTEAVEYTEELMLLFAKRLRDGQAAGEAMRLAKQDYRGDGIGNSYHAKALGQIVFYGLPMYRIGDGTPPPVAPTFIPTAPDPAAGGLASARITVNPVLAKASAEDGSAYYYAVDPNEPLPALARGTYVIDGRPIQPQLAVDVTASGLEARGAVIEGLAGPAPTPLKVTVARPVVDLSRNEPAIAASNTVFPSAFQNVTTFEDESGFRNRLVLVPGQWTADSTPGADPNDGFQRLFDSMTSTVYYAPPCDPVVDSCDEDAPTIRSTSGSAASGGVTFRANVTDADGVGPGTVNRVSVLYLDGTIWRSTELVDTGGGTYVGGGAVTDPMTVEVDYFVQAVDSSGNVGVSSNKAVLYTTVAAPDPGPGSNGAPVVALEAGPLTTSVGTAAPVTGTFSDDGSAPYAATVNNGDGASGTLTVTGTTLSGAVPAYSVAGTYVATVSVCDAEGACGTDTVVVSVTGGTAAPVAECTVLSAGQALTWWGATNSGGSLTLPVGADNHFSPDPAGRGQPTLIDPGGGSSLVATSHRAQQRLTWWLGGNPSSALTARGCA